MKAGPQNASPTSQRTTSRGFVAVGVAIMVAALWMAWAGRPAAEDTTGGGLRVGYPLPWIEVSVLRPGFNGPAAGSQLPEWPTPGGVYFFTSTCRYCASSSPQVRRLYRELRSKGEGLVGVALDGRLPESAGVPVGIDIVPYTVVAPSDPEQVPRLGVLRVPTIATLDANGVVEKIWTGEVTAARLREIIAAIQRPDR